MATEVIKSVKTMQRRSASLQQAGHTIALVPTMGFLHEGHLSLVDIARGKGDTVVMSIFVNPTQFGEGEDFEDYPRDFERDLSLAMDRGVDVIFWPGADDMYPENFSTHVEVKNLTEHLCGASRPGHFQGVTTVVAKLFNIVQPDIAIFGQKDAQQGFVLKRMIRDLNFPIDIVLGPIIREEDGVAMSSRNTYLSEEEREQALSLYQGLQTAKKKVESGEVDSNIIIDKIRSVIEPNPDVEIDYIEVTDTENLSPVETIEGQVLIAVAAYVGTTRLIDNIIVSNNETNTT
ncbi:MAG: pantoate--beta-alanine ligase [Candidatus Marinimicrobia bacterium]|nr:pantoate--beta-alanine ligase [Candidatus Neomarinimicrobiota bacterium]MCF7829189.1 pantoate--beta-alanine ligase [Candidatus Neomarinimicrobiota bacterium]MCF7881158.1 pantoate--beta-alanine ligase [Candidatus Neomarinimicrobiota bacterium]